MSFSNCWCCSFETCCCSIFVSGIIFPFYLKSVSSSLLIRLRSPERVLSLIPSFDWSQIKVWDDNRNASNLDRDWVLCDLFFFIFPSSGINSEPWNSSSADLFSTDSCPLLGNGVLKILRFTGGQISLSTKSVAKPTVSSVVAEVPGLLYPGSELELRFLFPEDCWQQSQDDYSRYY